MTKYILLLLMGLTIGLSAQTDDSNPAQEPPLSESTDDAMSEINKLMESFDLNSLLNDSTLMQSFGGQNLNGLLDSINLEGMPGLEGMDLEQMMEGIDMSQIMKMMEGIDMNEMQKMMEGIDMNEIMKMFEGMDIQGFDGLMPSPQKQKETPSKDSKKLKKI